ncbi:ABC transporter permease [Jatrophihabitans fulvus]
MPETLTPAERVATTTVPRARRRTSRRFLSSVGNLWMVGAILLSWEVVARLAVTDYFPPLSTVLREFGSMWFSSDWSQLFFSDLLVDAVTSSLGRFARGWLLAVVVGIAVGFVIGRSEIAAKLYRPVIRFWMSIPKVVLLPIGVQIFGIAGSMNVFLIFIGTVWVIMINTADGIAGVDPAWLRSAQSMHVSRRVFYFRVLLPAASPHIFAGLRVSIGIGLILMIVSELYATTEGLGYQIVLYQTSFEYVKMWSAFLLIALVGILLNLAFGLIEKRALRWQRRSSLAGL